MIQIADIEEISAEDVPKLLKRIRPVLDKRRKLHEKYSRKGSQSRLLYNENSSLTGTVLPFEKFITDLATGYTSGTPKYTVDISKDEEKNRILNELLDKNEKDDDYVRGMEILIEYVTKYNDDATENYDLIHDIFELTSCYEIIYENEENEIVYSKYDPLQTVAVWDYSIPSNLLGIVRVWEEENSLGNKVQKAEITDRNGSRIFSVSDRYSSEEERNNANWGDVPAICVETDFAVFEMAENIIQAYEQLIQNVRNTYQYNDADCKLMLTNYTPENDLLTMDGEGNSVPNPDRIKEDALWTNAKVIYVGENGNVSWLTKPVDAGGVETILKTYIDLMFQLSGIPNTSDLAFNSADLNASAIDRKFYVMNMATENIVAQLKKAYLRRWELIFNRINLKKGTQFDFRDINIELPKNLPANDSELTDQMLKLRDLISNQTIVEKLGYNWLSEKEKIDREATQNMLENVERMKSFGSYGVSEDGYDEQRDTGEKMEEDGPGSQEGK